MREETKFDLKSPSPIQKTSEEKISVKIQGMTCSGCVATVEKIIKAIDGIKNVSVSLIDGQAEIIKKKDDFYPVLKNDAFLVLIKKDFLFSGSSEQQK
jgi:copper chaperone CopZ